MKPLLIINGTLVTAENSRRDDIAMTGGKIISTGQMDPALFPGYEVIDATGKLVFPGAIDPHVHMACR
jgi:dihydropyrimidinase